MSAVVAILALIATAWLREGSTGDSRPRPADVETPPAFRFVGSEQCFACHADEAAAWQKSQHRVAMQRVDARSVLGNFDDASFEHGGVTTTFHRRKGRPYVRTDGPDGELADFEVRYVFGLDPLQQYLLEGPRGRLQALSVSWDARPAADGGQRWYHLYAGEHIAAGDELHWTRREQNWNFMCADCHATDVEKGYDAETDAYATRWSELGVGCEACHGPGSAHVGWARTRSADPARGLTVRLDERRGARWLRDPATGQPRRSVARDSQREIDVCAQCHARRAQIAEGYRAGQPLLDHYLPALLDAPLYHVDGQQRDEVYVWGSWLQSRMHAAGVTCSDCHDPHTQTLRAPGNAVCAQCHDATRYEAVSHHRHEPGSPGSQCADCHMPTTTYMGIDPRRDHSMRVPRPDRSVALGVPNACNQCHDDRSAAWAAARVQAWLGRDARGSPSGIAEAMVDAGGGGAAGDRLATIARDVAQPGIVRATALARLGDAGGPVPESLLREAVGDSDALVRLGMLRYVESMPPGTRGLAASLLSDPLRAVRIEAARVLAGEPALVRDDAWRRASDDYVATLRYNADRPESRVGLGTFYAALGRWSDADAAFASALRLDDRFEPAYVNAADALRARDRDAEAVELLQRGLRAVPEGASLHHALGLARVRLGQPHEAMPSLQRAADLAPDVPRYTYVYAVGLHSTGRAPQALAVLEKALQRWPGERDLWLALASFQAQAGQREAARRTASGMVQRFPHDPEAQALARQLQ